MSASKTNNATSTLQLLFSNPCGNQANLEAGTDAATRNSMSPQLLIDNGNGQGVVNLTTNGSSTYQNRSTFRNVTINGDGSEERISALNSSEMGASAQGLQTPPFNPLTQHFLPQSQIIPAGVTEVSHVVSNSDKSDANISLFKTENFVTWLNSSLDRLHDMREFEPGSSVRALLYNNFMQDFMVLSDELAPVYLKLLSDFLQGALVRGFWGKFNGQDIDFEYYVKNGGPMLEIDTNYMFPALPKIMNQEKKNIMNYLVLYFKQIGIPLIRIVDNENVQAPGEQLQVQSTVDIDIAADGSSLADGTLTSLINVSADQIKQLFLHFIGLTSKDQKYINIDGVNILLLIDAFKHSVPHQLNAFQTTAKSFIAAIDKANAKKWTSEKNENIQQINRDARVILFPQAGQRRTFTFKRYDNTHVQTEQIATVTQGAMALNEQEVLTFFEREILQVQIPIVAKIRQQGLDFFTPLLPSVDYRSRCRALATMSQKELELRNIIGNINKKITKGAYKKILAEQNRLVKMLRARGGDIDPIEIPKMTFPDAQSQQMSIQKLREILLAPIAQKILLTLPQIIPIQKTDGSQLSSQLSNLAGITRCPNFYLVEVEEKEGNIIIKTPTGSYQPLTCLDNILGRENLGRQNLIVTRREDGKMFIPLLEVQKLELLIVMEISNRTVHSILQKAAVGNGITPEILNLITQYIRNNAYSLTFLTKDIQAAFLEEVSHIELGKYGGTGDQKNAMVHGIGRAEKTATVAGHIFEPANHVGLVKNGELIDRIDYENGIGSTIENMDDQQILNAILIASMSVGKTSENTMDVISEEKSDDAQAMARFNADRSIFVTIDRAIINCIAQVSLVLNKIYPAIEDQQIIKTNLKTIKNLLTSANTGSEIGMYRIVIGMCSAEIDPNRKVIDYLTDTLTGIILSQLQPFLRGPALPPEIQTINQDIKSTLTESLQSLTTKSVSELCSELNSSETKGDASNELDNQWLHYLATQTTTHSIEDDPFEEVESSWFFGRRILDGKDVARELPLLATIINDVNSENSKPLVTLTSTIFPNTRFGPLQQGVSAQSNSAVSVAQVHRKSFDFYKDFLFKLVNRSNAGWKNPQEKDLVFQIWYKRLVHDEGHPIMEEEAAKKLFEQVVTEHVQRIVATLGDVNVNSEGDDDEAEAGDIKLHPVTSNKKIGFSRSLNGISGFVGKTDKAQRCLHYTLKSLAYSVIPSVLMRAPPSLIRKPTINAALSFCSKVRAYEGLKSAGDLLPLLVARSMNLCYSFERQQGVPNTSIFGGATFDKLCTMSAHLHQVPSVMIDVHGGVLCFGGFRGHLITGRNLVALTNRPTLVAQLDLQLASCDAYWIGDMNRLSPWTRTLHLLVLVLAQVLKDGHPDIYRQFTRDYQKVLTSANVQQLEIVVLKAMTNAMSNPPIASQIINFVGEQIDRLLTALIPSITNNCTINGFKIANKVNFQRQLRTQAIQMLNAFFQNNTNNPQELLNQLKYAIMSMGQPSHPQMMMGQPSQQQMMMAQQQQMFQRQKQQILQLQQQLAQAQAQLQAQAQQSQVTQNAQEQEDLRAREREEIRRIKQNLALLLNQFVEPGGLYNLMVTNVPRGRTAKPNPAYFNEVTFGGVLNLWEQIQNLRHQGNWSLLTPTQQSQYIQIQNSLQLLAELSGVTSDSFRGGGSRKKRKHKRKTKRKKKKRKKKTIKRRRKRGRKTRRK